MKKDVSKRVVARDAITRTVVSALVHHGPEIIPTLAQRLAPATPQPETVAIVIGWLTTLLSDSATELHDADIALATEVLNDKAVRDRRDNARTAVKQDLVDAAFLLRATYGLDTVSAFGLAGETPKNAGLVHNRAEKVLALLRSNPLPEKAKDGRAPLDAEVLIASLSRNLSELKQALTDVAVEERQYQLALEHRDARIDAWGQTYPAIAQITSGLFALAGRKDLARRVRPTANRRIGRAEQEDLDPKDAQEPANEDSAAHE